MALVTIPRPTLRIPAVGLNGENRHLMFTGSVIFYDEPRDWYFRGSPTGKRQEIRTFELDLAAEGIQVISANQAIPVHVTLADIGNAGVSTNARWASITRKQAVYKSATNRVLVTVHMIVDDRDGLIYELSYSVSMLANIQLAPSEVIDLRGPKGEDGKDGVDGRDGRDGADGAPGPPGIQGMTGP